MDTLVMMAREAHVKSLEHVRLAGHFRAQRDDAVRRAYATGDYSYTTLAAQTGISRELVVKIIQTR
jgi:hypothetical protein